MAPFVRAGIFYFAVVFAAGFVFAIARELVLVPMAGRTVAVLIEVTIMLIVSWIVCSRVVDRLRVPSDRNGRIAMGASAFVFLMIAEFGVAKLFLGWTVAEFFGGFSSRDGVIGLLAQLLSEPSRSCKCARQYELDATLHSLGVHPPRYARRDKQAAPYCTKSRYSGCLPRNATTKPQRGTTFSPRARMISSMPRTSAEPTPCPPCAGGTSVWMITNAPGVSR